MKTYLKVALTLLVLVFLAFFVRATDWQGVFDSVRKVGFNFLTLMGITAVSAWLSVVAWRYCLPQNAGKVSGWKLFWIRQIGENVAILNPTSVIGGEAMKIYMLRALGVNQRQALHSILLSRALTILSQLLMMLIVGVWFLSVTVKDFSGVGPKLLWWSLLPIGILAVFLLWKMPKVRRVLKRILRRLRILDSLQKARIFVAELWSELRTFNRENKRAMLLSFLASLLHWVVGAMEFYFILLFLGIKTTLAKAILVDMGVIVFKSVGAFIPGQIGVEEYGNKVMLGIIGVTGGTIWITVSILRRARQLAWILLSLLVYVLYFRKSPALS